MAPQQTRVGPLLPDGNTPTSRSRFGPEAEVLEPPHPRERVAEATRRAALYGDHPVA
ncbi:hypothetical protein [Embleya sp. NPDC005575]|uniref:hypothetical protein n=1 Tax=Embleya sp. NPDC005575 TaxID=3156892 RepID=UPI0033A50B68